MPAVIGVVFVFMVGVVVWVIVSSGDDDGAEPSPPVATSATTVPAPTAATTASTPPTTSPAPLPSLPPDTSGPPTESTAPTSAPTPSIPPTTAPGAEDGAVPGDLGIPGQPMLQPPCDGSYITILASPVGPQATGPGVAAVLDQYPGSNYLRTDQTCPSLRADVDGAPIYVIFFGPFVVDTDACTARADGPEGAYARRLSDELGPDHSVPCD